MEPKDNLQPNEIKELRPDQLEYYGVKLGNTDYFYPITCHPLTLALNYGRGNSGSKTIYRLKLRPATEEEIILTDNDPNNKNIRSRAYYAWIENPESSTSTERNLNTYLYTAPHWANFSTQFDNARKRKDVKEGEIVRVVVEEIGELGTAREIVTNPIYKDKSYQPWRKPLDLNIEIT